MLSLDWKKMCWLLGAFCWLIIWASERLAHSPSGVCGLPKKYLGSWACCGVVGLVELSFCWFVVGELVMGLSL